MVNSRAKGAKAERQLAAFLRARGIAARRGQQFRGSPDSPDIVCDLPGIHIEVKRIEQFSLYPALAQACKDAGDKMPVVAHRRNRQDWVAILRLEDLLKLLGPTHDTQSDAGSGAVAADSRAVVSPAQWQTRPARHDDNDSG